MGENFLKRILTYLNCTKHIKLTCVQNYVSDTGSHKRLKAGNIFSIAFHGLFPLY